MPKLQIFDFFYPFFFSENGGQPFSSNMFFFFLLNFSSSTFRPTSGERERKWLMGFFNVYFLIYCVFVEECVSPALLKRLVWGSAAVSVTSNPGKSKKINRRSEMCVSVKWSPPVIPPESVTSFTSCSLLVSLPAAQNQCEVLRDGCCRWNAAVFFNCSFLFLRFVVSLPVLVEGSGVPL